MKIPRAGLLEVAATKLGMIWVLLHSDKIKKQKHSDLCSCWLNCRSHFSDCSHLKFGRCLPGGQEATCRFPLAVATDQVGALAESVP